MEWWRLLLTYHLTATLYCSALSVYDQRDMSFVLDDKVMVVTEYLPDGTPNPKCFTPLTLQRSAIEPINKVIDLPHFKTRGYQLAINTFGSSGSSIECRAVPIAKDTQCADLTCPFGWSLLHDTCFLMTSFVGSWEEGQSFCQQRGGALATISSETQQVALSRILSRDTWIGLKLVDASHTYGWADGSHHNYRRWKNGEPTLFHTLDLKECVEMREKYDFWWSGADCDQLKLCLCSVPGLALTTIKHNRPAAAVSSPSNNGRRHDPFILPLRRPAVVNPASDKTTCHQSWIRHQSFCYRVFYNKLTYYQAKRACRRRGAYLASIHSKEEQLFIKEHLRDHTYIGLTDIEDEDHFTWEDGSPFTYSRWNEHEPNNNQNEDCVEMQAFFDFKWNDIPCQLERDYVCKMSDQQASSMQTPNLDFDYYDRLFY